MKGKQQFLIDLAERAFFTFVQAFIATYTVGDLDSWKAAGVAGVAAVLSLVKGAAASMVGEKGTAAMLPEPDKVVVAEGGEGP